MAAEGAGGGEFAELMSNHILGDVDRDVLAAVMDGNRVTDEIREDGGASFQAYFFLLGRLMISLSEYLRCLRVLTPWVFLPQGDIGAGIPTGERPSPPPCG